MTATAGPAGTVLQELGAARKAMGLTEGKRPASCSWAMLLARIYENRPLQCPRCGQAMTILAFILDQAVIERILRHIGEETTLPRVLPASSAPQLEMDWCTCPTNQRRPWWRIWLATALTLVASRLVAGWNSARVGSCGSALKTPSSPARGNGRGC